LAAGRGASAGDYDGGMTEERPGIDSSGIPYRIIGLQTMTDAELEAAVSKSSHSLGAGDILDEVGRRRADRQATLLVRLTWLIVILTAFVAVLTVVVVVRTA
jgi:hypothetical protein